MDRNQPKRMNQKLMIKPIFLIFKFFQKNMRVEVWLHENTDLRIQGKIIVRAYKNPSICFSFDDCV